MSDRLYRNLVAVAIGLALGFALADFLVYLST